VATATTFHNGLAMSNADSYLNLIGAEILLMLWAVIRLQEKPAYLRALTAVFMLVLGFMTIHLVSHVVPERFAHFLYGTHREYRSFSRQG